MSGINIQNVLDQLSSLAGAADSTQSASYLSDLSNAILQANNLTGVIEYTSKKDLPTPIDSSALGRIYFIPARADYTADGSFDSTGIDGKDTFGAFYYAKQISDSDNDASGYSRITTTKDDRSPPTYSFQGSSHGYLTGGFHSPAISPTSANNIERFSLTSDANATDVGDLVYNSSNRPSGQTSNFYGYNSGGQAPPIVPSPDRTSRIQRFPFAATASSVDVGALIGGAGSLLATGQSSSTHGYRTGGYPGTRTIEKFPFTSQAVTVASVGNTSTTPVQARGSTGQSSDTHGYFTGQYTPMPNSNIIEKFSFTVDGNSTDVGDLTQYRNNAAGQSSPTHGYTSGGNRGDGGAPFANYIDNFPFSSDANATDVGDLSVSRGNVSGNSSTTHGYTTGGHTGSPSASLSNVIDKFPFSSNGNATDVGDLTSIRRLTASPGQQN